MSNFSRKRPRQTRWWELPPPPSGGKLAAVSWRGWRGPFYSLTNRENHVLSRAFFSGKITAKELATVAGRRSVENLYEARLAFREMEHRQLQIAGLAGLYEEAPGFLTGPPWFPVKRWAVSGKSRKSKLTANVAPLAEVLTAAPYCIRQKLEVAP